MHNFDRLTPSEMFHKLDGGEPNLPFRGESEQELRRPLKMSQRTMA